MLLPLLALLLEVVAGAKQPNIVVMVADDLGWADIPWHESLAIAPTLTGLANTGIILDRHYVQPVCTPTRAALTTGKYPSRLGLQHMTIDQGEAYGLMANETIISNYMKDLGYDVHGVGKWHLGYCSWQLTPVMRGFDSYYGFYNGHETYYDKTIDDYFDFRLNTRASNGTVTDDVQRSANETYSAYLYAARVAKVIQTHKQDKPLFLYFPIQNVHAPNQVPHKYIEMYDGIIHNKKRRILLGMVTAMDDAAEVLVSALKSSGMWENTVFLFISDNGGPVGGIGNGQVNYPLRGGKFTYWEGGVRSASFIYSPMLPGGIINNELIHVTDWLPTLTYIATCGVEDIDAHCKGPELGDIDGMNQWQAVIGSARTNRTEFLVNIDQTDQNAALRMGQWKLYQGDPGKGDWVPPPRIDEDMYNLQFAVGREEWTYYMDDHAYIFSGDIDPDTIQLFDVEKDPNETREVSKKHPDVVKQMLERLEYHKSRAIEPRNVDPDPAADPRKFGGVVTPWLEKC